MTYVAPKRPKRITDPRYYPGTFRMERPAYERLSLYLEKRNISFQGAMNEAVDAFMKKNGIGPLFSDELERDAA